MSAAALYVAEESPVISVGRRGNDWSRRYGVECRKRVNEVTRVMTGDRSRGPDSSWSRRYGEHGARRTLICIIDWIWGARGTPSLAKTVCAGRQTSKHVAIKSPPQFLLRRSHFDRSNYDLSGPVGPPRLIPLSHSAAAVESATSLRTRSENANDDDDDDDDDDATCVQKMTVARLVTITLQHWNESYSVKTGTKTDEQ